VNKTKSRIFRCDFCGLVEFAHLDIPEAEQNHYYNEYIEDGYEPEIVNSTDIVWCRCSMGKAN
jgi:hypothetical protein